MGHIPDAKEAPAPPLDPPGVRSVFHGLRQGSPSRFSVVPCRPNSGVFVLPRMTAPEAFTRSTTTESMSGTASRYASEPIVDLTPLVASRSLMEIGIPNNGLPDWPLWIARSASRAAAKASSPVTVRKALNLGLSRSIRRRKCSVSSTEESCRESSNSRSCQTGV